MNSKLLIIAILSLIFWACSSESDSSGKAKEVDVEKQQWRAMEANEGGYALQVFVPYSENGNDEGLVEYLVDRGELRVADGEDFDYYIYEDESQMNMVLNEIANHPFYKVEIIEQTDSTLLYRFYLDDGTKEVWHFYSERSLGQPLLMIRSNQNGKFDEYYARKMLESSLKITTLK